MIILDTMILFHLVQNNHKVKKEIEKISVDTLATTCINIYELYVGAYTNESRAARRIQDIKRLEQTLKVLEFDKSACKHSALIHVGLKKKRIISTESDWLNDILIAGIAKSRSALLVTLDSDFERMDGLNIMKIAI